MIKAAARDFVPARDDLADEARILLGDPAENKKCRLRFVVVEQIQSFQSVPFVARLKVRPIALLNQILERADVKIVFDQNGQQMFFGCLASTHL